ncbi:hypothetical protein VTK26DRAFT_6669 [Humicola hyalothermophila]
MCPHGNPKVITQPPLSPFRASSGFNRSSGVRPSEPVQAGGAPSRLSRYSKAWHAANPATLIADRRMFPPFTVVIAAGPTKENDQIVLPREAREARKRKQNKKVPMNVVGRHCRTEWGRATPSVAEEVLRGFAQASTELQGGTPRNRVGRGRLAFRTMRP